MSTVHTNMETRLTICVIGLVALGGAFGRAVHQGDRGLAIACAVALAFVFAVFVGLLVCAPPSEAEEVIGGGL